MISQETFYNSQKESKDRQEPSDRATIKIAARKVPKFSAGKTFKDAVK
jgi:nucleoid DNA-binding protein